MGGFVYVNGALTLTSGTINANSDNGNSVSTLAGRADFGANTITVNTTPIIWNSQSIAPQEATFAFEGLYGSSAFNLAGSGTVEFTAQDTYSGGTHVMGTSTMLIGEYNAGSRYSTVTLDSGATLNLSGTSTILGGLAGSGVVTNTGANVNSILTVGYNNQDTTFSGQFNRYNDALPAAVSLTKIGTGNLILTGAAAISANASNILVGQASTGTMTVQQGLVSYAGAGTGGFLTNTIDQRAALW